MAQDKYVRKFGNWETEERIPYTVYFDKARYKKYGVNINPDNPQQNPNSLSENVTPAQACPSQVETKSGVQNGLEAHRTNPLCSSSREYEDDVKMNVPMFGNWETGDDVSYKAIFDRARYDKKGVKMNPNNPQRNPITFSDNVSPVQVTNFEMETKSWEQNGREAVRRKHVYNNSSSQDDGSLGRPDDSPWYHRTVNLKVAVESLLNRPGRKRARRHNVTSDSRVNRSPLSSWEGKGSTESGNNVASLTPGRSQQRSITQGAETPGHIAAVPKFGDWDDYIPTTADRYTQIFNKVREERLNGTGNVSASALGKPHYEDLKQHENGTFKQHVKMPRFGDWETNNDVPYTVVFDKARHKKKDVKMTLSNPQQSPNTFSDNLSPVQATLFQSETNSGAPNGREAVRTKHVRSSSREDGYLGTNSDSLQNCDAVNLEVSETNSGAPSGREAARLRHVRSRSREDGDLRTTSDSLQHRDTVNPKVSTDSPLHHHGSINSVGTPKRATRQNVGSDRRIEHSPLNPNLQAKVGVQVSGMPSPAWERKGSTERGNNLAPLTPGRGRLRSVTQGAETLDHGAAVPKFGEWDESDPTSADGFTHVFNQVREQKMNGTGNVSAAAFRKPYYKDQKQHENKTSKKCCCFPIPW